MLVNGKHFRTIWVDDKNPPGINVIDQRLLPHKFEIAELLHFDDFVKAIKEMYVRGAPLIGVTSAYAMYVAAKDAKGKHDFINNLFASAEKLIAARPTAVNLEWAVNMQLEIARKCTVQEDCINLLLQNARKMAEEDVCNCKKIGENGLDLIRQISGKKDDNTINILTHCNAGWLATVDYGTVTAPIYLAFEQGIKLHVWVDETRPRNQGSKLTSWELSQHGIPNTIIADNTGGHLMQHGLVDLVIVGSDRTTFTGDVANKTGTYLKALAAKDNDIPFYVALPSSSIDWENENGLEQIIIEERNPDEILFVEGLCDGEIKRVSIAPVNSKAVNYAFDVTPSRLVTGLITERGICRANKKDIFNLFPEKRK